MDAVKWHITTIKNKLSINCSIFDAKKRIIKSEILGECYLKKAKFESDLNLYNRINTIEIIISISVRLGHLVLIF